MAISLESFLVLEKSLTKKTLSKVSELIRDDLEEIFNLIELGEFDAATTLIEQLSLPELDSKYLEVIGLSALLFGASRLTPKVTETTIAETQPQNKLDSANIMAASMLGAVMAGAIRKSLVRAVVDRKKNLVVGVDSAFRKNAVSDLKQSLLGGLETVNSLHVSRLASYGFLLEAATLGIETYRRTAQLDDRTCPVCTTLDGKIFKVAPALSRADVALSVENPDDLAPLHPWPSQSKEGVSQLQEMSEAEISAAGFDLPPSHPRCRCTLEKV